MSGAAALKRDTLIRLKQVVEKEPLIKDSSTSPLSFNQYSGSNYSPFQRFCRNLFGLDIMEKSMANTFGYVRSRFDYIDRRFDYIDRRFDYIDEVMLKKSDLKELGAVFDARRGIFLSAEAITYLLTQESIHIKEIENKAAPIINSQ
jgi:hypothetical protein